jgi:predicted nuclease of restriction endonuclease-like (RecB) superfamily
MEIQNLYKDNLLKELEQLINEAKLRVASNINSGLVVLYWRIGRRVLDDILNNQRAEYGKKIVVTLSRELVKQFGQNFEEKNLRRMIQFAEKFPDIENVVTLSRQLSWSHFLVLIPLQEEAIDFYANLVYNNALGVRNLREQITAKAYERTENVNIQIQNNSKIEPGIFKDPYFLDFLGLRDGYLENDLESAILKDLEQFILELGNGFTFVERQKRIIIDGEDFHLDLLFYHRKLQRLVVIELKIDKFKAKYKGQMELYLKWLDKYEKQEGENTPIGLILCAETSSEQVELLEMHKDGIVVAEYWTELPDRDILESRLQRSLIEARERIARRKIK